MSKKVHLVTSPVPLESWLPKAMPCAAELTKPVIAFLWDEQACGDRLDFGRNTLLFCRECLTRYLDARGEESERLYVYGIRQSEAA